MLSRTGRGGEQRRCHKVAGALPGLLGSDTFMGVSIGRNI